MTQSDYSNHNTMKIVLAGKFGVGKTTIIHQYIHQEFQENPQAIEKQQRESHRGKKDIFQVELVDSMGIEKDDPNNTSYFQKCHGCAVVFDRSDESSFTELQSLVPKIKMFGSQHMSMILIGNKSDLNVVVDNNVAQQFATDNQMRYFTITAREKSQVSEAIEYLVDLIYKRYYVKKKGCCIV